MSTSHEHAKDTHGSGHAEHPSPPEKTGQGSVIAYVFFAVAFVIFVIWARGKWTSGSDEHAEKNTVSVVTVEQRKIPVDFTKEYGQKYAPGGFLIEFYGATEPYCVTNNADPEVCGEKGEDVDIGTPSDSRNRKLQIRSNNGKSGHLEIRLTRSGR